MLLLAIILSPLVGAVLHASLLRGASPWLSRMVGSLAILIAFILSLTAVFGTYEEGLSFSLRWIEAGLVVLPFELVLDPLGKIMLTVITGIGFLIHVYAGGYLEGESSTARFYAYLNLFVFMMLLLVLGGNLGVVFVGWEGVGLASYLLIGYWFDKGRNAEFGMKAFVVNRVGDIGFMVAMFICLKYFGTLSFFELKESVYTAPPQRIVAEAIALCVFFGACGKSAQIPLFVWLPDAMAGPTPVSALIHAATMVTAGIFLMTKLSFLLFFAPLAMLVIAVIGVLTALMAASIAVVQNDIKKVLAYSTVSQLGFMVLACGVGAFQSAVFHLTTHAAFKALLFLGAGSVIFALHHEQDMRVMGGLWKKMPITFAVFVTGVLAIIGFPGFSGFFSKDEILHRVYYAGPVLGPILWLLASIAATLTAFYMVRLLVLVFFGRNRGAQPSAETPVGMWLPLLPLAALSFGLGYLGLPHGLGGYFGLVHVFEKLLSGTVVSTPDAAKVYWLPPSHAGEWLFMGLSTLALVLGGGFALFLYRREEPFLRSARIQASFPRLSSWLQDKCRVDEFYQRFFVSSFQDIGTFLFRGIDLSVIGKFLVGVSKALGVLAGAVSFRASGSIHRHGMFVLLGAVVLFFYQVILMP